jgi:hypothetical protein
MINQLIANPEFMRPFLHRFAILGPINANLQRFLSAYYQWKKTQPTRAFEEPNLVEFYDLKPLRDAEKLFYEVGLSPDEAIEVVERHLDRLREFARYILAYVHASVLGNRDALTNASFVSSISLRNTVFDPERMKDAYVPYAGSTERYPWTLDSSALERFMPEQSTQAVCP